MEEQTINPNPWIEEEAKNIPASETLPAFKPEENKIYEVVIDFSKKFEEWRGKDLNIPDKEVIKKLIPLTINNEKMIFWLNVKNPFYSEILALGKSGKTSAKIIRTGKARATKYSFVN